MTETRSDRPDGPMSLNRLRVLLGAYGASRMRWPQKERAAAEALLDDSAEARLLLAEATQLDALLDLVHAPQPTAALVQRLRARRFGWRGFRAVLWGETLGAEVRRWMARPRHQAVAVAAALALGVLLGIGLPDADTGSGPLASVPLPAVSSTHPQAVALGPRDAGTLGIEQPAPADRTVTEIEIEVSANEHPFSSNGDPAFDAPDPFGPAAHGMDMVEGARLATGPLPASGEPLGSIPLL